MSEVAFVTLKMTAYTGVPFMPLSLSLAESGFKFRIVCREIPK